MPRFFASESRYIMPVAWLAASSFSSAVIFVPSGSVTVLAARSATGSPFSPQPASMTNIQSRLRRIRIDGNASHVETVAAYARDDQVRALHFRAAVCTYGGPAGLP